MKGQLGEGRGHDSGGKAGNWMGRWRYRRESSRRWRTAGLKRGWRGRDRRGSCSD